MLKDLTNKSGGGLYVKLYLTVNTHCRAACGNNNSRFTFLIEQSSCHLVVYFLRAITSTYIDSVFNQTFCTVVITNC